MEFNIANILNQGLFNIFLDSFQLLSIGFWCDCAHETLTVLIRRGREKKQRKFFEKKWEIWLSFPS